MKVCYRVNLLQFWCDLKTDSPERNLEFSQDIGIGFSPIFECLAEARGHYPDATIEEMRLGEESV